MSKVRIYGDTSGYVDIAVPAVAGTRTLNLDKVPQTATNGNTGIGTDNPSQNLHVSSTDHTRVLITGGTDKYAELQFENDAQKFAMGVQNDDKFFLYNSTGTSQVLTIDTSNNVGIGTSSPGGVKLYVRNTGTSSTTSPKTLLTLDNSPSSGTPAEGSGSQIEFRGKNPGGGTSIYGHIAGVFEQPNGFNQPGSGGTLQFATDGYIGSSTTRMTINSEGNVGIGTTNPAKRLDVFLPESTDGDTIRIARSNGAYYWHIGQTSSSVFYISNNDGNQHLTIAADGDIGIGTTPYANARLTIGGTEGGGYPAVLQFDNNNTSGAEFFMLATDTNWSAGSNKFIMGHGAPASSNADVTIDSNGYVGINTTSPQRALHIHDHAATGLHITNSQSGSGANDGFSQYIRDDNQATELMVRENSYLGFGTNNTLRARIESGGEFFWPEIGTRGDITFPICSISNNGSSNRYLHAQFQAQGGDMLHIHFRGYEYIGSSMREGSGGGYIYNTGGQQTIYAQGYSGHCVQVYQTTTNRVELVIDTGTSQTGNRWGSYVFFGGTDTITSNSPLTLVQYGWSSGTGRLYSS